MRVKQEVGVGWAKLLRKDPGCVLVVRSEGEV